MKTIIESDYFKKIQDNNLLLTDHLGGFDKNLESDILNSVVQFSKENNISTIKSAYVFSDYFSKHHSINFSYKESLVGGRGWENLKSYNMHPELDYQNFLCSFNGTNHVGRQLLASALNKFGYFNKDYCSKNFTHNGNEIDEHITYYVENTEFYNKFFDCTDEFNQQINSFGHVRFEHDKNIYNLENKLTQSFLHIVSETMPTSYYPFLTEKFLYSIVTRGLFLTYAQPGWHAHIEKYYGFKLYTKLFDYRFDSITNPVKRLIELMTMIGKFSKLTTDEWHGLYLLESDSIEYNYDHYFSKSYLKSLKQFDNTGTI